MKTIDFSYFIERYNAQEMSDAEKVWFQKELDGNKKLRAEVDLRKRTDDVLKKQDVMNLRNKLSEIARKKEVHVPLEKSDRQPYLKYAVLISVLILIGSITLFTGKKLSSEEIITKYYKSYDPPAAQRSGQSELNNDFVLALEFYNTSDYENAAILFKKVLESNPKDMQTAFLNGVSNFEDKKYPDAKQSFNIVINDNNNLFIESAKWYLALCYIKTNDIAIAIQQLEKIYKEGGLYKGDAKKIIRKLK